MHHEWFAVFNLFKDFRNMTSPDTVNPECYQSLLKAQRDMVCVATASPAIIVLCVA